MKKVISNLLLAVCIVVFLFSGWKLAGYYLEYKKADDEYDKIAQEDQSGYHRLGLCQGNQYRLPGRPWEG